MSPELAPTRPRPFPLPRSPPRLSACHSRPPLRSLLTAPHSRPEPGSRELACPPEALGTTAVLAGAGRWASVSPAQRYAWSDQSPPTPSQEPAGGWGAALASLSGTGPAGWVFASVWQPAGCPLSCHQTLLWKGAGSARARWAWVPAAQHPGEGLAGCHRGLDPPVPARGLALSLGPHVCNDF